MKEYAEFEHLKVGDKFKALIEFEVFDRYKELTEDDNDSPTHFIEVFAELGGEQQFQLKKSDYDGVMYITHPMARKRKLEERKHRIEINQKKQEEELKQLEEELKQIEGV